MFMELNEGRETTFAIEIQGALHFAIEIQGALHFGFPIKELSFSHKLEYSIFFIFGTLRRP